MRAHNQLHLLDGVVHLPSFDSYQQDVYSAVRSRIILRFGRLDDEIPINQVDFQACFPYSCQMRAPSKKHDVISRLHQPSTEITSHTARSENHKLHTLTLAPMFCFFDALS